MGYRFYLYKVKKPLVRELKKCGSEKDLYEVFLKHGICQPCEPDEDGYYDGLFFPDLPTQVFEFGKYYDNADAMTDLGKPLFTQKDMADKMSDYGAVYGGEELIRSAIDWQIKRVKDNYTQLADNTFEDDYDKSRWFTKAGMSQDQVDKKSLQELHYRRLLDHVQDTLYWLNSGFAHDLDTSSPFLTGSWLYEYTIFDLIRILKEFNPSKEFFVFLGH